MIVHIYKCYHIESNAAVLSWQGKEIDTEKSIWKVDHRSQQGTHGRNIWFDVLNKMTRVYLCVVWNSMIRLSSHQELGEFFILHHLISTRHLCLAGCLISHSLLCLLLPAGPADMRKIVSSGFLVNLTTCFQVFRKISHSMLEWATKLAKESLKKNYKSLDICPNYR